MQVMDRINAAGLNELRNVASSVCSFPCKIESTGLFNEVRFCRSLKAGNGSIWQLSFCSKKSVQVSNCQYQPVAHIYNNFPSLILKGLF
jgi:hypothetical protein